MSIYIFIDGGYLRSQHAQRTQRWFGKEAEINFSNVISRLTSFEGGLVWEPLTRAKQSESVPVRSFYYDCLDEDRRADESEATFKARLEKQNKYIDSIRAVPGCHLRLGALKGSKKIRRQKEVDILLAVDMMTHAARQNMTKAVLLAGDQDFKPAVESLVQLGVFVHVVGDYKHTSRELTWAASSYTKLSFDDFYYWTTDNLQTQSPTPQVFEYNPDFEGKELLKEGILNDKKCSLYKSSLGHIIFFPNLGDQGRAFRHSDLRQLELYLEVTLGSVTWNAEINTSDDVAAIR